MTKTATSARNDNPLAGFGAGAAEGSVGGYAGAEHGLLAGELGVMDWGGWGATYGCVGGLEGVGDGGYVAIGTGVSSVEL